MRYLTNVMRVDLVPWVVLRHVDVQMYWLRLNGRASFRFGYRVMCVMTNPL